MAVLVSKRLSVENKSVYNTYGRLQVYTSSEGSTRRDHERIILDAELTTGLTTETLTKNWPLGSAGWMSGIMWQQLDAWKQTGVNADAIGYRCALTVTDHVSTTRCWCGHVPTATGHGTTDHGAAAAAAAAESVHAYTSRHQCVSAGFYLTTHHCIIAPVSLDRWIQRHLLKIYQRRQTGKVK